MEDLPVYFVTGNRFKYELMKKVMKPYFQIKWLKPDREIKEIEDTDVEKVLVEKIKTARELFPEVNGILFITDVGFYIEELGGRPGALIKRETKKLFGGDFSRWCEMVKENRKAKVLVGVAASLPSGKVLFIKHEVHGRIPEKPLRGEYGFDWDEIFVPEWDREELEGKSFAQVPEEEKIRIMLKPIAEKFAEKINKNLRGSNG